MRTRSMLTAGLLATALVASACSSTETVSLPSPAPLESPTAGSPTPSVTTPTPAAGTPQTGAATPTPTEVPTDPPPVKPGNSRAIVKGDTIAADLEFTEVSGYPIYEPPTTASLTWTSKEGSLTIGGDNLEKGTHKTSDKLAVSFTILAGGHTFGGGEKGCRVTIDKVTDKVFKGWFSCPAAVDAATDEEVKVIASFEYKP